jgi:L-alanine-DL-glutamate epimerase-like enolase superfamily enzyme
MPGAAIHTESGLVGYGFAGTHAHLATDRLITTCITDSYAPLLIGRDPREVRALWNELYRYSPIHWVGRAGIVHLALGAIDIALWDLKAKGQGLPLWKLLGGSETKRLEAYNTDGGWLSLSVEELVEQCRSLVEVEGYRAVKIKVGSDDPEEDLRRLEAVRRAVGTAVRVMVDVNGRWDLPTAQSMTRRLEPFQIDWIEEPLFFDDLVGHRRLASSTSIPIALGEQLYMVSQFRDFIEADAVHYVQPDVTRLAGITEWWQVAELAHASSLPVVPHVGDMGQVHQHLCRAHSACSLLEYIPWIAPWMKEPVRIEGGNYLPAQEPGAGLEPTTEAMERLNRV